MIGMILLSTLLNVIAPDTNVMSNMPWHWHLVLGGFAFGMFFMATDPVSASSPMVVRVLRYLDWRVCVPIRVEPSVPSV